MSDCSWCGVEVNVEDRKPYSYKIGTKSQPYMREAYLCPACYKEYKEIEGGRNAKNSNGS